MVKIIELYNDKLAEKYDKAFLKGPAKIPVYYGLVLVKNEK